MRNPCLLDDGDHSQTATSCSMVLRSACTHGHSHNNSLTVAEERSPEVISKQRNFKRDVDETAHLSTIFTESVHSSLKYFALNTAKTYSTIKKNLYSKLEFSGNNNVNLLGSNGIDYESLCVKDANGNKVSMQSSDSHLNKHMNLCDDCLTGSATNFSDSNNSVTSSRMRRRNDSHIRGSLNALSDSENEDASSSSRNSKSRRIRFSDQVSGHQAAHVRSTSTFSNRAARRQTTSSAMELDSSYLTSTPNENVFNDAPSMFAESPPVDYTSVQYSYFDKFRWCFWRRVYLAIIKCINFDVWLLSRINRFGKWKCVSLILLCLLIYLLCSAPLEGVEDLRYSYDLTKSFISTKASSLYSAISSLLYSKDAFNGGSCPNVDVAFPSFTGVASFFSSLFKPSDTPMESVQESSSSQSKNAFLTSQAEELLRRRISDLENKIQLIQTLQKNTESERKLENEMYDLRSQFKVTENSIKQLERNTISKDRCASSEDLDHLSMSMNEINEKILNFEEKLTVLNAVKKCCDDRLNIADVIASFEKHFINAFKNVMNSEKDSHSPYKFFNDWLQSKFIGKKELTKEVDSMLKKIRLEQKVLTVEDKEQNKKNLELLVLRHIDSLKEDLAISSGSSQFQSSLSLNVIKKIVKEAIMLYDADKTGKVDYALESGGGSVLGTRCSESYVEKNGKFSVFGFPLWSDQNTPRTAIQPDIQPGKCWAFKGSQGFLVIQLAYPIYPSGFTLEHIPLSLSPTGSIDSAPKEFSVWRLESDKDNEGNVMGKYSYDQNGEPLQYFPIQNVSSVPVSMVELKVHTNQGNLEYTCLYRFRVHGNRV